MAQTKRKRRSKHRGTPAGTIKPRGGTGRKATPAGRKGAKQGPKEAARDNRAARFDQPPTWRSAANRAAIATAILVVFLVLVVKPKPAQAIQLAALALLIYIPMGYYTDLLMYRRRQAKKLRDGSGGKAR